LGDQEAFLVIGPFDIPWLPFPDLSLQFPTWGDLLWPVAKNRIAQQDKSPYHVESVPDLGDCPDCQSAHDDAVAAKRRQDKKYDQFKDYQKETLKVLDEDASKIINNAKEFIEIGFSFVLAVGKFKAVWDAEASLYKLLKIDKEKLEFTDAVVKLLSDIKSF